MFIPAIRSRLTLGRSVLSLGIMKTLHAGQCGHKSFEVLGCDLAVICLFVYFAFLFFQFCLLVRC